MESDHNELTLTPKHTKRVGDALKALLIGCECGGFKAFHYPGIHYSKSCIERTGILEVCPSHDISFLHDCAACRSAMTLNVSKVRAALTATPINPPWTCRHGKQWEYGERLLNGNCNCKFQLTDEKSDPPITISDESCPTCNSPLVQDGDCPDCNPRYPVPDEGSDGKRNA